MSEDAEWYAECRERQQKEHAEWRDRTGEIVKHKVGQLEAKGHAVKWVTEWQIRIDGRWDVYWQSKRYHDIRLNKRGDYHDLISFIQSKTHEQQP